MKKIMIGVLFATSFITQLRFSNAGVGFHLERHLNVHGTTYISPTIHFDNPLDREEKGSS